MDRGRDQFRLCLGDRQPTWLDFKYMYIILYACMSIKYICYSTAIYTYIGQNQCTAYLFNTYTFI